MLTTTNKLIVHRHVFQGTVVLEHDVFEGELEMTQAQQDYYQQVLGNGRASVTVSRELSESSYGNGGKVFVSVTLHCDQNQTTIDHAIELAKHFAEQKVWAHHSELKNQLVVKGLLKP
jgi:hypothetical protein